MSKLYLLSATGFVVISLVFYTLLYFVLRRALRESGWTTDRQRQIAARYIAGLLVWTALISILSIAGITSNFGILPFNFAPVLLVPLITILWITFSGKMKHLLPLVPRQHIVRLQVFRVFVELVLWAMVIDNLIPIQMSFEDRNLDVLTGLTAPLAAWLIGSNRKALVVWNILGLALLVNIVGTALLSMPTPFRVFHNEPANTIVLSFPFIFLPGLLVPLAYGLHALSLRQLALERKAQTTA